MKKVFADTGYWIAVVNPHDDLHNKALQVSRSLGPHLIVTSEMVLSEMAAYFSDKGSRLRQAVVDLIRSIRTNPNSRVVPQTSLQFQFPASGILPPNGGVFPGSGQVTTTSPNSISSQTATPQGTCTPVTPTP